MNEAVNIILGNSFGNALSALDMNIFQGKVPADDKSTKLYNWRGQYKYLVG